MTNVLITSKLVTMTNLTLDTDTYSLEQVADILGVSKETLRRWDNSKKLVAYRNPQNDYRYYLKEQLQQYEQARLLFDNDWEDELHTTPIRPYKLIELFAGAGGLAIGLEKAGFESILLNEIDRHACATLRHNRPNWNVIEGDISQVEFSEYQGNVDLLTGGFPCQAFSYAGKKLGFEDTRGTLFYEFARAVNEVQPSVFVAENVRGLQRHNDGKTLETICSVIDELGYDLVPPRVLKAVFYQVPQKRERLFLVGIKKTLSGSASFKWPSPYHRIMTMRDALKAGELFPTNVPQSLGQSYPQHKKDILDLVPPGGYWRDLPDDLQRKYMMKSYFLGGGKTGMARRLSWDEPSLTLTTSPAQKQTERCHPDETRPLTVREYARIQTFPDEWKFSGPITSQYRQIGNAVPANLAYAMGRAIVRLLNDIALSNSVNSNYKYQY